MSLPHFTNIKSNHQCIEPIYKSLFNIDLIAYVLSENETKILSENIHKIGNGFIEVNANDNFNVEEILMKIKDRWFNLELKIHDKQDNIKAIYKFKECKFENLIEELINYKWQSNEIMRYKLNFKYDDLILIKN